MPVKRATWKRVGDLMIIGVNFHKMYLDRPQLLVGSDRQAGPLELIAALMDLSKRLVSSAGSTGAKPAVQLGVECAELLTKPRAVEQVGEISRSLGVEVIIHHPDWSYPGQEGFTERLVRDMEISQRIGGRLVIFHAPPGPCVPALKIAVSAVLEKTVLQAYGSADVSLAVENIRSSEGACFSTPEGLLRMVVQARRGLLKLGPSIPERFGVCLDYGHFTSSEGEKDVGNLVDGILKLSPAVIASHIHFNDGTADQHLLIDEHPENKDALSLQDLFLATLLPSLDNCKAFVIERNAPFSWQQLVRTARSLC